MESEASDRKSFEAKVFARFDSMKRRLDMIDKRLENLVADEEEMHKRWGQVSRVIANTNISLRAIFDSRKL